MAATTPVRTYSWDDLVHAAQIVAAKIIDSNYEPTLIISVLRGGAFAALVLSHMLKVRPMYAVSVSSTVDDEVRAARRPLVVAGLNGLPRLEGERILVVDDVTNTGSTLLATTAALRRRPGSFEVRTAALVWDTVGTDGTTRILACVADYVGSEVHAWVQVPWVIQ